MSAGRLQEPIVVASFLLLGILGAKPMRGQIKRGIMPEDYFSFEVISDPHPSPGGKAVTYVLTTIDQKKNRRMHNDGVTILGGEPGPSLSPPLTAESQGSSEVALSAEVNHVALCGG